MLGSASGAVIRTIHAPPIQKGGSDGEHKSHLKNKHPKLQAYQTAYHTPEPKSAWQVDHSQLTTCVERLWQTSKLSGKGVQVSPGCGDDTGNLSHNSEVMCFTGLSGYCRFQGYCKL